MKFTVAFVWIGTPAEHSARSRGAAAEVTWSRDLVLLAAVTYIFLTVSPAVH